MRVLIWGSDSWANQGDDAILAGTIASLRSAGPQVEITVASACPQWTERRHGVRAARRVGATVVAALWRADIVLWGGGQMLQNESSKPFLWFHLTFISLALALRKPVVCYAQGAGEISGRFSRWWTAKVLNGLTPITVRDEPSAGRLAELCTRPFQVTADPSFVLEPATPDEAGAVLRSTGIARHFIAIAVRRWGHYRGGWLPVRWQRRTGSDSEQHDRFCAAVAGAADAAVERWGVDVLLVAMCPGGDQGDDAVAAQVVTQMRHPEAAYLLAPWLAPGVLKAVLGRAELVLAMRTHAAMLAAGAGAPVVSISYQGKGRALMERLGLEGFVRTIEEVDGASLVRLIEAGWENRPSIRARTARMLPELRRLARLNAEIALKVGQRCASAATTGR
ncbi:MAG: polysaccharide pyruvyl transferase family protein [Chloroflexota bacterium]